MIDGYKPLNGGRFHAIDHSPSCHDSGGSNMKQTRRSQATLTRRAILGGCLGVAGSTIAILPTRTNAQETEGTTQPDFGGWLDGVDGDIVDLRGQDQVTVQVGASGNGGAFAFSPAGIWIDPGTTVSWNWTGEGGGHNVHSQSGADFQSDITAEPGVHFEYTFDEEGISTYQCDPHATLGMKGGVAVGDNVPTVTTGSGDGGSQPIEFPGGDVGAVFGLITLATVGFAGAAVIGGEVYGAIKQRSGGVSSAYTSLIVASVLGIILLLAIILRLVIGG